MTHVLENIHANDYQWIPGVIDCQHHVRRPNGEEDQSHPAHVLFDNSIAEQFTQVAVGLILSTTNQLAYFWRDNSELPAPRVNDLITYTPEGSQEPEHHAILRVETVRLGKFVIATQQVREDVEP
jgi:hypothetical protein